MVRYKFINSPAFYSDPNKYDSRKAVKSKHFAGIKEIRKYFIASKQPFFVYTCIRHSTHIWDVRHIFVNEETFNAIDDKFLCETQFYRTDLPQSIQFSFDSIMKTPIDIIRMRVNG